MEYNYYLQNCGDDSVISFSPFTLVRVDRFKSVIDSAFSAYNLQDPIKKSFVNSEFKLGWSDTWYKEGVTCEILKIGAKGWQKGKIRVRVSLEFEPEEPEIKEPESPLEDLRRKINDNS
ncbi:MAG: KGK domain-containing protein [Phormidium sp.]